MRIKQIDFLLKLMDYDMIFLNVLVDSSSETTLLFLTDCLIKNSLLILTKLQESSILLILHSF